MKKHLVTLVTSAIILSACSEEDKAYYLKNIEKAETKNVQCELQMKQAWQNKDKNAIEKLAKDTECNAAKEAIKEDRKIKAALERQKKDAADRIKIEQEKAKIQQELGQADWKSAVRFFVNSNCAQYGNSINGEFHVPEDNYHCKAAIEIYKDYLATAKNELLQLPFAELSAQEKNYCSQDKREFSACFIWESVLGEQAEKVFSAQEFQDLSRLQENYQKFNSKRPLNEIKAFEKVFNEKEQTIVDHYVKHYDVLKQDYNQCVTKLIQIGHHWKKHEEREAVKNSYPCSQTSKARRKLGLAYDDFNTFLE
ncbi:MAG: hypothetical protein Q4B95_04980 [Lonepinella koalarum]|nr:hypothetical protein [Lonepinella koalarum]